MSTSTPEEPPPAYTAHRAALIGLVVGVFLVFGLVVALELPAIVAWIAALIRSVHQAWSSWHWHLL